MNMGEVSRMIVGLRLKGWTDREINDFILYIENANVQPPKDVIETVGN